MRLLVEVVLLRVALDYHLGEQFEAKGSIMPPVQFQCFDQVNSSFRVLFYA